MSYGATNIVVVMGRLTAKPEVKRVGESDVCNFQIAHNRSYKKDNKEVRSADFFKVTAWDFGGMLEHFEKGDRILVEGLSG